MATREASIWRSVIHAHSIAFKPYSPKDNSPPRHALPLRRPRICFLYFTFLGINIAVFSLPYSAQKIDFAQPLNLARGLHRMARLGPATSLASRRAAKNRYATEIAPSRSFCS